MTMIAPGICRHCGCTPDNPCAMCLAVFGECSFTGREQLVCGAAPCLKAEKARKERNAELARHWRNEGRAEAGLSGKKGRAA